MTLTGPGELLDELTAWAVQRFGPDYEDQGGFQWYLDCRAWSNGPTIQYNNRASQVRPTVCVGFSGQVLGMLAADERVEVLAELLAFGMKCTRCDVALDFHGSGLQLIERVTEACKAGQLVGARCFKPITEYKGPDRLSSFGVTVGTRGRDGSGRFLRVYDKGLEKGCSDAGNWVRWEEEFSGDVAQDVAASLCKRGADWVKESLRVVLGAIDFRERTGRRHLDERPRLSWWAALIEGIAVRCVRAPRVLACLESVKRWVRSAVAPTLMACAKASGVPLSLVVREFFEGATVREGSLRRLVVHQFKMERRGSLAGVA